MEWLDDADEKVKAINERERLILEHGADLYESLWNEVKAHAEAARKKFPALFMNGQHLARSVKLPVDPVPPATQARPRMVSVALQFDKHSIFIGGDVEAVTLMIDVCEDGYPCLKLHDAQVSLKDAAIAILRPFLYPELYPALAPPPSTSVAYPIGRKTRERGKW